MNWRIPCKRISRLLLFSRSASSTCAIRRLRPPRRAYADPRCCSPWSGGTARAPRTGTRTRSGSLRSSPAHSRRARLVLSVSARGGWRTRRETGERRAPSEAADRLCSAFDPDAAWLVPRRASCGVSSTHEIRQVEACESEKLFARRAVHRGALAVFSARPPTRAHFRSRAGSPRDTRKARTPGLPLCSETREAPRLTGGNRSRPRGSDESSWVASAAKAKALAAARS